MHRAAPGRGLSGGDRDTGRSAFAEHGAERAAEGAGYGISDRTQQSGLGMQLEKHEIYACKLGDPWNWNCFAGLSTDSCAVTVGSDGDFTGAASYLDYILFFKADRVHIVQGRSLPIFR